MPPLDFGWLIAHALHFMNPVDRITLMEVHMAGLHWKVSQNCNTTFLPKKINKKRETLPAEDGLQWIPCQKVLGQKYAHVLNMEKL